MLALRADKRSSRHGRDNKLLVWQLGEDDEHAMESSLPVEANSQTAKQPWLLYSMPVNALNFCPFTMCYDGMPQSPPSNNTGIQQVVVHPILFAVPNAIDSGGVSLCDMAED